MIRWAKNADQLLKSGPASSLDARQLEPYFETAFSSGRMSARSGSARLAEFLTWVSELEDPGQISEERMRLLTQLCSVYRALSVSNGAGRLVDLIEGLTLIGRGRVTTVGELSDMHLTSIEGALIEAIVAFAQGDHNQEVQLRSEGNSLHVTWPHEAIREAMEFVEVWRDVSMRMRVCAASSYEIKVKFCVDHSDGDGPIERAVRNALVPKPDAFSGALANLLHDLKNQLSAASQAGRLEGSGRTSILENRLTASRHLDRGLVIARRIRETTRAFADPTSVATEVHVFLRRYSADLLIRMPQSISISPPSEGGGARAAIDEHTLSAALENLVKNSVEALGSGGRISLEWYADEESIVIELADDGPGLPDGVVAAFSSGKQVESQKPGGNGLGLLGTEAVLTRIGGSLEYVPSPTGTVWHLQLPRADVPEVRVGEDLDAAQ
jgi:hypothetical protein